MIDEYYNKNSSEAQEIRNTIYELLMENSQYFCKDFNGMFDSDDAIECEINDIVKRVKNGQDIEFVKQPTSDFINTLQSLVEEYIHLGGRDDVICMDG